MGHVKEHVPLAVQAKPAVMMDVVVHVGRAITGFIVSQVSAKQLAPPTVQAKPVGMTDVGAHVELAKPINHA